MTAGERDAVGLLGGFTLVAGVGVAAPLGPLGWRILGLAVLFTCALVALTFTRRREWLPLTAFLVPLSAFQVLPDAFLSAVLGTLVFDETGGPRLGPVPLFMALLWTIPLFAALQVGLWAEGRWGARAGLGAAVAAASVVLLASEATLWALPIWHARGVWEVAHVAVYVALAEVVLGAAAWTAFRLVAARRADPVLAAATVATLYTGALALAYLLVEAPFKAGPG